MMGIGRQVLFWISVAILFGILIGLLEAIMLPFVAGIVIAYFLSPVADKLTQRGIPRALTAMLIVVAVSCLLVAALILLVPLLLTQIQQFAVALPDEIERLQTLLESWARQQLGTHYPEFEAGLNRASQGMAENWGSLAGDFAGSLWSQGLALFNFLSLVLVTPVVVFYVLIDWHSMLAKIDSWLPRDHAPTIRRLASDINDTVAAFIRGQGTICLILSVYYVLALSTAGLRYSLLVGLGTGILSFIPFVGWALGLISATIIAVIQFWPQTTPILIVLGVFAGAQVLDGAFLSPKIVGSKVGLHPVWIIFSLFAFSYLFGLVGVLLAVPIGAAIAVLVRFALKVYLESTVYQGEDVPPHAERPSQEPPAP